MNKKITTYLILLVSMPISFRLLPPTYPIETITAIVKVTAKASVKRNFKGCILIMPETRKICVLRPIKCLPNNIKKIPFFLYFSSSIASLSGDKNF